MTNPWDDFKKPEASAPAAPWVDFGGTSAPPPAAGTGGYGGPEPPPGTISPPATRGWGDVAIDAVVNAPRSAYDAAAGIVQTVASPVETVKTVGNIIEGGLSKLGGATDAEVEQAKQRLVLLKNLDPDKPVNVPGMGMVTPRLVIPNLEHIANQNSTERVAARKEIEKNFDTMKDFYVDRYGSMEGFKKAVAEDPVGVLLDASTAFTGVGGGLRGAGVVASKVGATGLGTAAGVAGSKLGQIGAAIDPINQALNIGKWAAKGIPTATSEIIGGTTGAGADALSEAFQVAKARAADPSNVSAAAAYQRLVDAMSGARTPEQTVALANQGIQTMKQDASRAFQFAKENPTNGWYHDATVLNTTPIRTEWNKLYASMFGKNGEPVVSAGQLAKIEEVGEIIAKWEMGAPAGHTLGGFDDLKRAIENMRGGVDDRQLNRVVTAMTKEAKDIAARQSDTIYANQPNLYRESQAGYQKTMSELDEIEKSLGVGRSQTSIDSAARKLTSIMRNNVNTNFGQRLKNVETLEKHGSIDIVPEIAGHALNTWSPRGIMRSLMSAGIATGATAGLGLPFTSPKLMGHAARGLGTMAGLIEDPMKTVAPMVRDIQKLGAPVAGQLSNIGQGEYGYGAPPLARGGTLRRIEGR